MSNITDKARNISKDIGYTFLFGSPEELDAMIIGCDGICICMLPPDIGNVEKWGTQYVYKQTITITVVLPIEYEAKREHIEDVTDECRAVALSWLAKAEEHPKIKIIDTAKIRTVSLDFTENFYSGVSLQFDCVDYDSVFVAGCK